MMMSGTLTLSNGKNVKASVWANGTVTWEQFKMVRHGSGTATGGFAQRTATPKQAATFVLDSWVTDIDKAEKAAYAEDAKRFPVVTEVPEKVAYAQISNFVHLADVAPTAKARAFWTRKAQQAQRAQLAVVA